MIRFGERLLHRSSASFASHTIEPTLEPYLSSRSDKFTQYMPLKHFKYDGWYSQEGVETFGSNHPHASMRELVSNKNMKISCIGIGTYKGSLDESDDILQFNAVIDSVMLGSNVIDTCSNFRGGRSEISIGTALRYLIEEKKYSRNQIFICSKAGFVREDI